MPPKIKLGKKAKNESKKESIPNYYEIFGLKRNDSIDNIVRELNDKLNVVIQKLNRVSTESSVRDLKELKNILNDAIKRFRTKESRALYDEELDYAIEHNLVDKQTETIAADIWAEIEKWYLNENYEAIIRKCTELLNTSADIRLYNYLSESYFFTDKNDMALATVNKCVEVHPRNLVALKLAARAYNNYASDVNTAQKLINQMLEIDPESPITINEQFYLYLCIGNKSMAYAIIDEYIEKNPSDFPTRKEFALSIINYSYRLFEYTRIDDCDVRVLADEKIYLDCLDLARKAASICDEDIVKEHLKEVEHFGEIEFNVDNAEYIKWMKIGTVLYGISAIAILVLVGFLQFLLAAAVTAGLAYCTMQLINVSKRPLWQVMKYYLTGKREKKEKIYILVGRIFTGYMKSIPKITFGFMKFAFKLALPND